MSKLNQIVAIEKGVKTRVYSEITELHKSAQKSDLFNGFARNYRKINQADEDLPSEKKKVQLQADEVLASLSKSLTQLFNVTAQKDIANQGATADVVVDGTTVLSKAPSTYLIFLEKQMVDIRTFIDKLPVLDDAEDWTIDPASGLHKTSVVSTHRTKKIARPIVLYDATKEHPAQTQLIQEDVIAGFWDTIKQSGALPAPRKAALLERVDKLVQAVKFAREQANNVDAGSSPTVGEAVFGYLFK